jgi:hypothetical protein
MTYERLGLIVMWCGLVAACSSVGPDDGVGGSGGPPTGIAGSGEGGMGGVVAGRGGNGGGVVVGRGGMGGAAGGAGGLGGGATSRGGNGGGVPFTANDLPCLKTLFADCPTEPGTCQFVNVGIGGAQGNSSGHLCYASGTTANTFLVERDCNSDRTGQNRYYGEVHRPDGTLCYTFLRTCECSSACEITQFTFRSAAGDIIATGQRSGERTTFSCVTGETCPAAGAGGNGGSSPSCIPFLPGLQCVEGTCP